LSKRSSRGIGAQKEFRVIYPAYFDKNLSWKEGRRVPLDLAYDNPELQRVALAAKRAGFEVYLNSDKHYPGTWFNKKGRVLIRKDGSKEDQLRNIAQYLSKVNVPKSTRAKPSSKKKPRKGVYRQKPR
jgi:signal recognition particle subunit SRP19